MLKILEERNREKKAQFCVENEEVLTYFFLCEKDTRKAKQVKLHNGNFSLLFFNFTLQVSLKRSNVKRREGHEHSKQ